MNQTVWVIQVLDDSKCKSIEYKNRIWLRQHVKELNIRVCVEDCNVDTFEIADAWKLDDTIFIQNGNHLRHKSDFHPGKEGLLLVRDNDRKCYWAYLYLPKE